jgi:hypothetical protein
VKQEDQENMVPENAMHGDVPLAELQYRRFVDEAAVVLRKKMPTHRGIAQDLAARGVHVVALLL